MRKGVSVTGEIAVIAHDEHRFSGPRHRHQEAQFLYAVSGVVSVTTDRGSWIVPPSRAVWIPPGLEHETTSLAGVQFRSLLIDTAEKQGLPENCMVVAVTPLLRELILKLAELAEKSESPDTADAVVRLFLLELTFQPAQPLSLPWPQHPGLGRLCARIRGDLARDIPVEEAAATLNMSRATFMRVFKRETGMTFNHWRRQARMLAALSQLAEGRSVLDVALGCGYDSPSAFSAVFRRSLGCPPSRYF